MILAATEIHSPLRRSRPLSPLRGVSDAQWHAFIKALEVQGIRDVSESGGLGSYDLRPRRLAELGYMRNLHQVRPKNGRIKWGGEFVPPLTQDRFLANPVTQLLALARSMSLYQEEIERGRIIRPEGVSLAGALTVLHIAGVRALERWADPSTRMSNTQKMVSRADGIF